MKKKQEYRAKRFIPGTVLTEEDIPLDMLWSLDGWALSSTRYSFPTHRVYFGRRFATVYEVPDDRKEWLLHRILKKYYIYMKEQPWDINSMVYLWGSKRTFILRDYIALYYRGLNRIVSPFFFETGETFDDFSFNIP